MKIKLIVASVLLLSGCAKNTQEIQPSYVSPMQYQSYSCRQLEQEMQLVSRRMAEVGGFVDKTASDDAVQMGVGLVLLWPTLFWLDGDTPQAAEYARLKGEFQAIEGAGVRKNCNIKVEKVEAKPYVPAQNKRKPSPAHVSKVPNAAD